VQVIGLAQSSECRFLYRACGGNDQSAGKDHGDGAVPCCSVGHTLSSQQTQQNTPSQQRSVRHRVSMQLRGIKFAFQSDATAGKQGRFQIQDSG
jgi:hypothetical protein